MNKVFPKTLVQIHYHDRPGGVRKVMDGYSRSFRRIAGKDAPNFWMCKQSGDWRYNGMVGIALPDADYHSFRTRQSFERSSEKLTRRLLRLLETLPLEFPVAVIGHNLNLGKNPALSSAFADCAHMLGEDATRYRFFSVLHDFAEAGRVDLLFGLRQLTEQNVEVYRELYAAGAPVHFVVPNRFSAGLSGLGKREITVLPNPAGGNHLQHPDVHSGEIRNELQLFARRDGLFFDPGRTLYCYPSRMIYRKNVFEALLVATVVLNGSLVTGAAGASAADRRRMHIVRRIAGQFGLSLVVDPARLPLLSRMDGSSEDCNPFTLLYRSADCILTTSVAEGFGFSLFEPWLYGKPVIGRRPSGMSLLPGMAPLQLYDRLPVPRSWVSIEACYLRFAAGYRQAFGKPYASLRSFTAAIVKDETVDFGLLDDRQQADIIMRILHREIDRTRFLSILQSEVPGWPGSRHLDRTDAEKTDRVRSVIRKWNDERFDHSFMNCLAHHSYPKTPLLWYRRIGAFYEKIENFRPISPVHLPPQ